MIAHLWGAGVTHFGDLEAPFEDMVVQLGVYWLSLEMWWLLFGCGKWWLS